MVLEVNMQKEINDSLAEKILSLVHDFHRRSPSDYTSVSKGIDIMGSLSKMGVYLCIIGMALGCYYDYNILVLFLAIPFYFIFTFYRKSVLIGVIKSVYEEETSFVKSNRQNEDDDFQHQVRLIVKKYLKGKQRDTQSLIDKAS